MSDSLEQLFTAYAAQSFEKQYAFADLVGNHAWNLSLSGGRISFEGVGSFPVQLLGTESEHTGTWLWAWANRASKIPANLLQSVESVRKYGEEHAISELVTAQLPLDQFSSHYLTMICSGLCDGDAYYRCPYEGGAAFVLVSAPALREPNPHPVLRMVTVFSALISTFDVSDHKATFLAYIERKGLNAEAAGAVYRCQFPNGDRLIAEFDRQNRLVNLNTELKGNL